MVEDPPNLEKLMSKLPVSVHTVNGKITLPDRRNSVLIPNFLLQFNWRYSNDGIQLTE